MSGYVIGWIAIVALTAGITYVIATRRRRP